MVSYNLSPKYFLGLYTWKIYVPKTRIFSVTRFVLYSCPILYLFFSICTQIFLACLCSNKASSRKICNPAITPIHIWSTYSDFDHCIWNVYFWCCTNLKISWIYYFPLLISVALNTFQFGVILQNDCNFSENIFSLCSSYWIIQIQVSSF